MVVFHQIYTGPLAAGWHPARMSTTTGASIAG